MLDMLEFNLDAATFRSINQFKTAKVPVGTRPLMVFAGTAFESPVPNELTMAKSMLIDFFRGEESDKIDVEGLQYVVVCSADEPTVADRANDDVSSKPVLHLRVYLIRTKRSGQKSMSMDLAMVSSFGTGLSKAVPAKTISGRVPTGTLVVLNWFMLRKVAASRLNSSMSSILLSNVRPNVMALGRFLLLLPKRMRLQSFFSEKKESELASSKGWMGFFLWKRLACVCLMAYRSASASCVWWWWC